MIRYQHSQSLLVARDAPSERRVDELAKVATALQASVDALSSVGAGPALIPAVLRIVSIAFSVRSAAFFEHLCGEPIRLRHWLFEGHVYGPDEIVPDGRPLMNFAARLARGFTLPDDYLGGPCRTLTQVSIVDHHRGTSIPEYDRIAIENGQGRELRIPLVVDGMSDGALVAYRDAPYTAAELSLAESLGKQLALAVQLNHSASASLEAALARQRALLSEEMHDDRPSTWDRL